LHPVTYCDQALHTESPIDLFVYTYLRGIELIERDRVVFERSGEAEDQVTPHLKLALSRVKIQLDGVEEGPLMIGWQLELSRGFNHVD
jgi:hypothetical protein